MSDQIEQIVTALTDCCAECADRAEHITWAIYEHAPAGLLVTSEHDAAVAAEWADHFEVRQGAVGSERLTVESMIAALRGPRPFGCEACWLGSPRSAG